MSDLPTTRLPTRKEAAGYLNHWQFGPIGEMFRARADGELQTRAEWEATIPCPGNDPTCPGHDHGDPCNYREETP